VSIATQFNSTQLNVELSCVAINGPLETPNYLDESRCVAGDDTVAHDAIDATVKVISANLRLVAGYVTSNDESVVSRPWERKHWSVVVDVIDVDRDSGFRPRADVLYHCRLVRRRSSNDRYLVYVLPLTVKSLGGADAPGRGVHVETVE